MRKSFFTVDFQNKETKTESSRPGLRPGVSVCQKGCEAPRTRTALKGLPQSEARDAKRGRPQKGCEAPRTRTALKGLPQSEACDAKRGRPPKRVRSTEGEHAAQRQRSPKPATRSGAGRQKGCEAPRTRTALKGLPQSEARDAKRGGPPKRVRSTEGEHAAQRQRSPKPATRSGAGRQKGCEARNPQGNGLSEGFLHSLSLKNKLRIDNGTLWI